MDERRLWAAVLLQAVKDLVGYTLVQNERERARLQYFARLWFTSDNYEMGSFRRIFDELGVESSWIRRQMIAALDFDQAGKEASGRVSLARLQSMFDAADEYTADCVGDLLSA